MSATITNNERSQFSLWVQAARTFSFPASVVPMLVGIVWVLATYTGKVYWELTPIILLAGVAFHAGTNMLNDYYDHKKGVDTQESYGSSRIILDGLMEPETLFKGSMTMFAFGFALGLILVYYQGVNLLYLGLIGLLGGMLYTGFNISYKYFALGDLAVFLMFGPLMVLGTYASLTGVFDYSTFFISIPIGFLTIAILNANNIRDIIHDKNADISTMATVMGNKASKIEYYILVLGAFLSVAIMVGVGFISPWALLVFISLKPALDNIKYISKAEASDPELIKIGDVKTAQHNLMFGVLYTIGILIGALTNMNSIF